MLGGVTEKPAARRFPQLHWLVRLHSSIFARKAAGLGKTMHRHAYCAPVRSRNQSSVEETNFTSAYSRSMLSASRMRLRGTIVRNVESENLTCLQLF